VCGYDSVWLCENACVSVGVFLCVSLSVCV